MGVLVHALYGFTQLSKQKDMYVMLYLCDQSRVVRFSRKNNKEKDSQLNLNF